MIAFLIGAGVGLLAGAGLGAIMVALVAKTRIGQARTAARNADAAQARAEARADRLQVRCDAYVGELDALVEATRPPRPSFDANPTISLAPGQTYTEWYAAYADALDREQPGWWEDLSGSAAGELVRLAEERRAETYEQNELDQDRIPTREAAQRARSPLRPGMAIYPRYAPRDGEGR
ncbi:hypothetical protein [Phytohabitans rumicis]|uniref:Uncharacterized protein n=1 Tax=Phytohabitans rumicis TaxID=1076125 RepID=A0A6V8L984_9ACTN|nr:hypothetical protein [Phytohabitans rumicis]GFJ91558.1 hypothetical protein Prum_052000 [Phytohabitans rumicis]